MEKLLTPIEVAAILSVSVGTLNVWRCTRRVELPFIKIGRSVRYPESALQKFIDDRRAA